MAATNARKSAARAATPPAPDRYADHLKQMIETAPKRTKGERTKDLLKLGAIQVLEQVGYHAMRVSDICEAAEVGTATFYLYFGNKEDITRIVLAEYLDAAMKTMATRPSEGEGPFEQIRASNLKWLQVIHANAGLQRCILQLGDEAEDFRYIANTANKRWYERIALSIVRSHGGGVVSDEVALLAAYSLGSMMDELARKLIVHPDPSLVELKRRIASSHEEFADFLAVLWHQALYGPVPDSVKLAKAARDVRLLLAS